MKKKTQGSVRAGGEVRLQKYMADCGVAARRKCEEMIAAGHVEVNGVVVTAQGTKVIPGTDQVRLNGSPIERRFEKPVYYMLNKPVGYLVSAGDPFNRKTIYKLLASIKERVVPVGRLDLDSSGLLLLTNDGELAHRLMHPRFKVEKEYEVCVDGEVSESSCSRLRSGVIIEGYKTAPAKVRLARSSRTESRLFITILEGKKRQVRLMMDAIGHPVKTLRRIREGNLRLGELPAGQFRALTAKEISTLRTEVGLDG